MFQVVKQRLPAGFAALDDLFGFLDRELARPVTVVGDLNGLLPAPWAVEAGAGSLFGGARLTVQQNGLPPVLAGVTP